MRKVLIVTYFYAHPYNVGGGIRVQKFVKYLPEFGWHPVVLTTPSQVPPASMQQGSAEFSAVPPGIEINAHPIISSYTWLWRATRAAERIINQEQIDVIFANCGPFVASLVAVNAAQRTGIPSVADFRDAWSFNPYSQGPTFPSRLLESYVLRRIQFLLTTTPANTAEYVARYPFLASRIQTLCNGFDEADFPNQAPPPFEQFTIVTAGALYAARQPDILFEAMQRLSDKPIRLLVMGTVARDIRVLAAQYGVGESVRFLGRLEQRDAIREMGRGHMLLLLQGPIKTQCRAIAGKTYEYIRSGLPILAILPEGQNATFIREHARQAYVITTFSVEDVAEAIEECYHSWLAGSLTVRRNEEWEASFNRREIARQLATLLDGFLSG